MSPRRAASVAAVVIYGVVAALGWSMFTATTPDAQRLGDVLVLAVILGTPLAAAGAVLARRLALTARGADIAERLVAVATARLDIADHRWAEAMRAELASIDEPADRRRFAMGCVWASVRTGIRRTTWLVVSATGILFAAGVVTASRASLGGGRGGILGGLFLWAVPLLFAAGLTAALVTRSFQIGLLTGGLALVVAVATSAVVMMAEGAHWYHVAGVFLADGDVPKGGVGLDLRSAVLDPLRFVLPLLLVWTPWPVLGAAAASRFARQTHSEATPEVPAPV